MDALVAKMFGANWASLVPEGRPDATAAKVAHAEMIEVSIVQKRIFIEDVRIRSLCRWVTAMDVLYGSNRQGCCVRIAMYAVLVLPGKKDNLRRYWLLIERPHNRVDFGVDFRRIKARC